MPKLKPTWSEKLRCSKAPVIKTITKAFADMPEGSRMFIASPALLHGYLRTLSCGEFMTTKELRANLADHHRTDHTCPVTTGIFLRIVAEAAWEQLEAGVSMEQITPFWRVIDPDSPLAGKLSCGRNFIHERRSAE